LGKIVTNNGFLYKTYLHKFISKKEKEKIGKKKNNYNGKKIIGINMDI
jgi:hypothetical protein